MNTKFTAAAQAIAEHFKQAEAQRGEPFRDTFTNPMCNDAVMPNFVGIPLALLRALVDATAAVPVDPLHVVTDAERFKALTTTLTNLDLSLNEFFFKVTERPTREELLSLVKKAIELHEGGAA